MMLLMFALLAMSVMALADEECFISKQHVPF
jgi:hypothetical protein